MPAENAVARPPFTASTTIQGPGKAYRLDELLSSDEEDRHMAGKNEGGSDSEDSDENIDEFIHKIKNMQGTQIPSQAPLPRGKQERTVDEELAERVTTLNSG